MSYKYEGTIGSGTVANQRLSRVTDTSDGPGYELAYDKAGNLAELQTGLGGSPSTDYFGYDKAGQLCWEDTTDHTGSNEKLAGGRCDQATAPGGATAYTQDAAGNSVGTTGDRFGYNEFNQVVDIDGATRSYRDVGNDMRIGADGVDVVHSALGMISRTTPATDGSETTYYLYTPDGEILASYPAMTTTGFQGEAVYYVTDRQGSVVMLVDSSGDRAGWYRYSPYGVGDGVADGFFSDQRPGVVAVQGIVWSATSARAEIDGLVGDFRTARSGPAVGALPSA